MKKKVVLAYSGGLDTSVICHWLASKGHDVVCVTVDVGQPGLDAAALEKKALASGASKFRFVDAKGDFVKGVFQCGYLADGDHVRQFESMLRAYLGNPYVITAGDVASALMLCLFMSEVRPRDEFHKIVNFSVGVFAKVYKGIHHLA